jgi:hypothetical protein
MRFRHPASPREAELTGSDIRWTIGRLKLSGQPMCPNAQQGSLWVLTKVSFRNVLEKFIRISAEIVGDLALALVILVGISAIHLALRRLNGGDLVFFEHFRWPLEAKTLFDLGHVANLSLFLIMSFLDCMRAYRHKGEHK